MYSVHVFLVSARRCSRCNSCNIRLMVVAACNIQHGALSRCSAVKLRYNLEIILASSCNHNHMAYCRSLSPRLHTHDLLRLSRSNYPILPQRSDSNITATAHTLPSGVIIPLPTGELLG